jgi:4-hydroxy-2-oxoheptanedioate aldolase
MRTSRLRTRWAEGEAVVSAWLSIGSGYLAEIIGWSGVDCVTVDLQHGMIDMQTLIGMLQSISATPATPIVRVPSCDPPLLMKALDAGAYGVICPMINSAAQLPPSLKLHAIRLTGTGVLVPHAGFCTAGQTTSSKPMRPLSVSP